MTTMHNTMRHTMPWLLRREVWEHKGMLMWVPLTIAGLLILLVLLAALNGHGFLISPGGVSETEFRMSLQFGERQSRVVAETAATIYPIGGMLLYPALAFMVFFYSLGALYDERRDRSILFWKSLPISDTATVLSKAALALLGIPLLIVTVELVTSVVLLVIVLGVMAANGANLYLPVLTHPQLWLGPFKLLSLVPVYALWALPTVGWLLLISAWARSKVFMWAVGVPALAAILLAWAQKALHLPIEAPWLIGKFISRLLIGVMPGTWLMADGVREAARDMDIVSTRQGPAAAFDMIVQSSWAALGTVEMIGGALAGAAMITAAIWLRRRREDG